ncbi:Purple acid phosphatase 7, partial [Durusdinium trenchii]
APFGARDKGRFACDSLAETTMAKFWRFLLLSPAAVAQQCVELLIIGDYGTRNHNQAAVAQGLAKLAGERQPQAVAAIGDNIYPDGAAFNPYTITRWWGDVYMPHAELQRPWHVITGNHDWWTDALYERAYTGCAANQEKGGHWQLPHFWYKKSYTAKGLTVDAFYIDTQIWKGSPIVDSKLGPGAREEQKQWLFSGLAESTADWRIVLGHHPVYSAGNHGVTEVLLSELDPKLRELGVPVYFAGHDHSKQVIYWEGMSYVISGSGGATARARSNQYPEGSLMHYFPDNGFVGLSVCNKQKATVTIYSSGGDVQATWKVRNAQKQTQRGAVKPQPRLQSKTAVYKAAACHEVQLKSVEKWCSADGCKVLADSSGSCADFCGEQTLRCSRAWAQPEEEQDCTEGALLPCDVKATNSSLICECAATTATFLP